MKKAGIIVFVLLLIGAAGLILHHFLTTPREEGVAHLEIEPVEPFFPLCNSISEWIPYIPEGRPAELIDLPGDLKNPSELRYFYVPIGAQKVYAIIETLSTQEAKAWIDTNMDLRLSDETGLSGTLVKYTENKDAMFFGQTQLAGDTFSSQPFHLTCYSDSWIRVYPVSYETGRIRLENRIHRIILIDGDYDGRFETLFRPSKNTLSNVDVIYAEPETWHLFKRKSYDLTWLHPLGRYHEAVNRYYQIEVSEQAKTLHMKPAQPAWGKLKLGVGKQLFTVLYSDAASQTIIFSDEIALPVGQYQMISNWLTILDQAGTEWQFRPFFTYENQSGQFEITEGQTLEINPGPPFTINTNITDSVAPMTLGIDARLAGNEGETYGLRLRNGMTAPTLKITDENGAELHSGTMEYG